MVTVYLSHQTLLVKEFPCPCLSSASLKLAALMVPSESGSTRSILLSRSSGNATVT